MTWIWQQASWPSFSYDPAAMEARERAFLVRSGELVGAYRHVDAEDQETLRIDLISDEAVQTSAIEGEILDRDSVQSSLRQQFGLGAERPGVRPIERGVSRMMADLYRHFARPLDDRTLFDWHSMLLSADRSIGVVGGWRRHAEPMRVVSGPDYRPRVHFEAPPSGRVAADMELFVDWFNATAPDGATPLPALTRSAIAHLHFECIHPFEDGNGRIGRALSEKALAQCLGHPSLIALASTIERGRKAYYAALEDGNKSLEIDGWLRYFGDLVLDAQRTTIARVEFAIAKTRFYDRFRGRLNDRQEKVVARLFRAGPDGFAGGLSAENYISIARTSRASATRDLQDLVELGALVRTGERRYTRYALDVPAVGDRPSIEP
ncbi:Fic family protein [Enterovirga rhinocerotis]|uniref:Fic family protein n=1 Tax=Enterovirga rhinocerotis TaxID=1339210 RepID=A0A4R7BY66_9HYPH|nr:Fic family protein [Enterovirga rhinocerotis]TDR89685.1 Fic family protein [Enterovirga rhinocerotis]